MNRRGFLLGETAVKVVVAIIAIILLIALLVSLYATFSNKDELLKAEATLNSVVERVGRVASDPNTKSLNFFLPNPKDWLLLYYENGEPSACEGEKCLCVCDTPGVFGGTQANNCNKVGICQKVSRDIIFEGEVKIPASILIEEKPEGIEISK